MLSDDQIRFRSVTTLAEGRFALRRYTFDYLRRDGLWQQLSREVYNRTDSAVVLLYCPSRRTLVLTRQFRLPVLVSGGHASRVIEAPAGLLGSETAAAAIRRETEEETGICLTGFEEVFAAYMNPGLVTERTHFFIAEYSPHDRRFPGGGIASEGEDIEAFEVGYDTAMAMFEHGEIVDGKTILLLLYAKTRGLFENQPDSLEKTSVGG